MKKIIVIFGIIFLIFITVVFFQININKKPVNNFFEKSSGSTVTINSATYKVELAKTRKEQEQGLSGRKNLASDAGMLFVFDKPSYYSFWMRGVKFPLDIIFISSGKVSAAYENLQPASANENPPQYGFDVVSDQVLEVNAGEISKNNIKVGDVVTFKIN